VALPFSSHSRFLTALPGEEREDVRSREVVGSVWSRVRPTPVRAPCLLAFSDELFGELGIESPPSLSLVEALAGNGIDESLTSYATCYGGYQFGHWADQLGDGRAIILGVCSDQSSREWEIQLKGAGRTPYSRRADGRAVLRSSIREFLCSEAMHSLGIPTTRALALVGTGEEVVRDMFYDGNPQAEPGAIVTRVAPSFLRFGHYELLASRNEKKILSDLVEFTIRSYYPEIDGTFEERVEAFFLSVVDRTASLIARWMGVGFVHGVMNTDNMSILGLTIDYGPYGWMDEFDPVWTPNTTDFSGRRYCYQQQPAVGAWNCERLGEALEILLPSPSLSSKTLTCYKTTYSRSYERVLLQKFGCKEWTSTLWALVQDCFALMRTCRCDMTLFFEALSLSSTRNELFERLLEVSYKEEPTVTDHEVLSSWTSQYYDERERNSDSRPLNPSFTLRNFLTQGAIDLASQGNNEGINNLLIASRTPFVRRSGFLEFYTKRPAWAENMPGCSTLSCSS
jgi:serine/tyrosine/threonine adenylyltransferase